MPSPTETISESAVIPSVTELATELRHRGRAQRHRQLLVLAGPQTWCRQQAQLAVSEVDAAATLWVGLTTAEQPHTLASRHCQKVLGREFDALIFDAWDGFDPDAFGAVCGTVVAGGLLLLLTPPLADWPHYNDPEHRRITTAPYPPEAVSGRYLRRLAKLIENSAELSLWCHGQPPRLASTLAATLQQSADPPRSAPYRSADQAAAVAAVIKVACGQRRRPVVLSADRGRGKSAALGIAAGELMRSAKARHIAVTGPRREAVQAVFEHAARTASTVNSGATGASPITSSDMKLSIGDASLRYFAADQLLADHDSPIDLLLVDEAAALPTPILSALLKRCNRIAFATTVHGYEGSGRGFALRFNRLLDSGTRGWRSVQLQTPIRWAANDPVEAFSFRALLMNADAARIDPPIEAGTSTSVTSSADISVLDRDQLAADEATLSQLFGLLVLSHYRTRPYDLRQLLDGPNLRIVIARWRGAIVGTALVAREGGFDANTAEQIRRGQRRPRGHLLPEAVAAHLGLAQAAQQHCLRIMRIAVHPALRRHGIGHALLDHIADIGRREGRDYLGTSFGADASLMRFWRGAGYRPVRVSVRAGATSAAHSVLMLHGLSDAGNELYRLARQRFFRHLPAQLSDHLHQLDAALALDLLSGYRPLPALDAADLRDIDSFAYANSTYEDCNGALVAASLHALSVSAANSPLSIEQRTLLLGRVLQQQSWSSTAARHGLSGRRQTLAALRAAFGVWLGEPLIKS